MVDFTAEKFSEQQEQKFLEYTLCDAEADI